MVGGFGVLQHVVAVVAAKAVQGLLRGELVQFRKGKYFARAVVLPCGVVEFAIAKSGGSEIILRVDDGDGVSEIDAVGRSGEGVEQVVHGH